MNRSKLPMLLVVWATATSVRGEVEAPLRDDPRGRQAARALEEGPRTPEDRLNILEIARAEAHRSGLSSGRAAPPRAAGNAWVNLGPRTANFEKNGVIYLKVDSGRARTVLVHPT